MKKNILITGASGYTGSRLVAYLSEQNVQVFSLVRKSTNANKIDVLQKISKVYFYDETYQSIAAVFRDNKIDAVIHLAALAQYDYQPEKIDEMINSNFRFGVHILEAMVNGGCKNFINFSTYWQNNENGQAICLYAALKQSFENIISFYSFDKNISAISLRMTDIYGHDDNRPKIFTQLKNYQLGTKIKMSNGKQEVSLIYIDDILSAVSNCLDNIDNIKSKHLVYYVYGNEILTLRQIVDIYNQETGKNVEVDWGALPYRKNQIMKLNLGELLPNFKAKYNLKDVVKYL
jgi:nucleoside-diphosphate-sugar epimerase